MRIAVALLGPLFALGCSPIPLPPLPTDAGVDSSADAGTPPAPVLDSGRDADTAFVECTPGERDCVGDVPRVCDGLGHWTSFAPCISGTSCIDGTCTAGT